ncbi:DUF3524 domain-containing protein [Dasania sp. GY-MA-18]|uniref:tRNA-queuosine alpha-mannosyltransferase n=1 Tax=Dasania phycosphaerae TaxID=2950436 RepID=A0A9J6RP13_9GAMM|nr:MULTISPECIES: DUF3524 domain-containing protein [Dasania]MCR8923325.1 DUF3524 domain-containing protein [Dasania sp. GY-MA-18]MCZ0865757.1 DUF3524 domain-containing protein [Dasania phycosphaerae]MCZ0869482.1 DUF3524 domain-containing protein [Dasania phycosphaerae]
MRRILLLSAYHTNSHKAWCDGLISQFSEYHWTLLSLPDRYFRWRIRGNPLSWYESPLLAQHYDLIVATSMVDLATLKGLQPQLAATPSVLYFHENQFEFPASQQQHASVDPQMVNLYSAMAANTLAFNSQWNHDSFFAGVERLFNKLPDQMPQHLLATLAAKSTVLPVAIADDLQPVASKKTQPYTLVWAARWEYDKGPERLLAALELLEASGLDYRLNLIGPQFRQLPVAFEHIQQHFQHRLLAVGYQNSRAEYLAVLQSSDVFISTAIHEFQGLSALEAVACGCIPLVPARLSYPELFAPEYCYDSSIDSIAQEAKALVAKIIAFSQARPPLPKVHGWQWPQLRLRYQALLDQAIHKAS